MSAHGFRANQVHAQFPREIRRFGIEIVKDFQVIRDESDRRDYYFPYTGEVQLA